MTKIVVLRPDQSVLPPESFQLAPRTNLPKLPVIGVIENGKALAGELLFALAKELGKRIGSVDVVQIRKLSSAYPISEDEAIALAARAHIVITGVGD